MIMLSACTQKNFFWYSLEGKWEITSTCLYKTKSGRDTTVDMGNYKSVEFYKPYNTDGIQQGLGLVTYNDGSTRPISIEMYTTIRTAVQYDFVEIRGDTTLLNPIDPIFQMGGNYFSSLASPDEFRFESINDEYFAVRKLPYYATLLPNAAVFYYSEITLKPQR